MLACSSRNKFMLTVLSTSARYFLGVVTFDLCTGQESCQSSVSAKLKHETSYCKSATRLTSCCSSDTETQVRLLGRHHREKLQLRLTQWKHRWLVSRQQETAGRRRRRRSLLCLTHRSVLPLSVCLFTQQVKFQCAKPATVCLFWKEYFWQQVKISLCGPCVGRCVCLQ